MKKLKLQALNKETRIFLFLLAVLIVLFIALVSITAYGVYRKGWENNLAYAMSSIIPLPAATVNGKSVQFNDYLNNLNSLKRFYAKQLEQGNFEQPTDQQLRENALERIIFDSFVREIANEMNISISEEQVSQEIEKLTALRGERKDLKKFLNEWYGWSIGQYKKSFLEPALLYDTVNEAIREDDEENINARIRMQKILEQVNAGKDFGEAAIELGEESGQETPGEIFVMARGSFPSYIEDELIVTPVGTYTDILTLDRSLQIIKVEGRDAISGLLQLRRIYIPLKTIEDVILEKRLRATVINFIF